MNRRFQYKNKSKPRIWNIIKFKKLKRSKQHKQSSYILPKLSFPLSDEFYTKKSNMILNNISEEVKPSLLIKRTKSAPTLWIKNKIDKIIRIHQENRHLDINDINIYVNTDYITNNWDVSEFPLNNIDQLIDILQYIQEKNIKFIFNFTIQFGHSFHILEHQLIDKIAQMFKMFLEKKMINVLKIEKQYNFTTEENQLIRKLMKSFAKKIKIDNVNTNNTYQRKQFIYSHFN